MCTCTLTMPVHATAQISPSPMHTHLCDHLAQRVHVRLHLAPQLRKVVSWRCAHGSRMRDHLRSSLQNCTALQVHTLLRLHDKRRDFWCLYYACNRGLLG